MSGKLKILFYTKYTRKGASSRLRSFQYFPLFEKAGFQVGVQSLFNDQYLRELYGRGRINKINIIKQYFKRFYSLFSVRKYDLIVIEKELFPYLPAFFEKLFSFLGVKYIVDYDDAIFHNYDKNDNRVIRFFLRNKIDEVIRCSSLVTVGNEYLQNKAIEAKAKNVFLLPTVIDKARYEKKKNYQNQNLVIGWIGSPITIKYLSKIKEVLKELSAEYEFKLHIIGARNSIGLPEIEEMIEWKEETEVNEILKFDIGIMPLEDSDWEKGKCAYKLIQYMACGVPVVGSKVGANTNVIKDGYNGYLAKSNLDWYEKLKTLIVDKKLRMEFAEKGYETVMINYSLQSIHNSYFSAIRKILN